MKVYLLKAFDINNFKIFTPSPAGFTKEEDAKKFCEVNNNEKDNVYYDYTPVEISESFELEVETKSEA